MKGGERERKERERGKLERKGGRRRMFWRKKDFSRRILIIHSDLIECFLAPSYFRLEFLFFMRQIKNNKCVNKFKKRQNMIHK